MKFRKLLSPYLGRMRFESFLRALFAALAGGIVAAAVTMLAMWILNVTPDFTVVMIIAGATAAVILIACYLIVFHVSYRDAVRRVDAAGMQARLITMHELRKDTSYMAQRQREDTVAKLKELKLSAITLNLPRMTALVTAAAVLISCGLFYIPLRAGAVGGDPYVEDPYEEKYDILTDLMTDIYLSVDANPELEEFLKGVEEDLE